MSEMDLVPTGRAQHSGEHHLYRVLPTNTEGRQTYALLSTHPRTETAIIFVHGFAGDSVETWVDFQGRVDLWNRDDWWEKADLFFFSYPSVKRSTAVSADRLLKWIRRIFPHPDPHWFELDTADIPQEFYELEYRISVRPEPFSYKKLVLVGHSEGGIILRRMMINMVKSEQDRELLRNASLRLFAPALFGAMPTGIFGTLLQSAFLGGFARMWLHHGAAYQEMKQNSKILDAIKEETERFARDDPLNTALRALILWGEDENIVQQGEYECDIRWDCLEKHDHVSICKPTDSFEIPLEFVCEKKMIKRFN